MIPILYEQTEENFTTNGIGRLSDIISCTVTEERNGIYECEFTYPITGIHYDDIAEGRIIACIHDDGKTIEPFDIYARTAPIDGVVTFYAHHISYRLSNVIVSPFTAGSISATFSNLKGYSINSNPFTFYTDKTTTGNYTVNVPSSIRELLCGSQGSILDVYGSGEYEFTRKTVKLWAHRGTDTDVEIRYGKNLLNIEKNYDISGTFDAVAPFWYSDETGELVVADNYIVYSPEYVAVLAHWMDENGSVIQDENGTTIDFSTRQIKALPLDLSNDFEEKPTSEQLASRALQKMTSGETWLPSDNIKVDFLALWQTPEYENIAPLQRVKLCDTVNVYFEQLGVHAENVKVIRVVYNVLNECYDEIELGTARSSFAETVQEATFDRVNKEMASKGFLEASLKQATNLITGGLGGYVVINSNADGQPQEILVMDSDNINTAVNVIRINKNGIGFSQNGYNGPFSSAWTIDNTLDMENVNVINLSANALTAGTVSSRNGGNTWNLVTGLFKSDNGTRSTQITAGRIRFYKGTTQMGYLGPFAWGNDFDEQEGVTLLLTADARYLGFGAHGTSYIVINNGLNPGGETADVIFTNSSLFQGAAAFRYIEPYSDYAEVICAIGDRDKRFYQVWSSSFNFATGVYINYNSTGDYIYTSKAVQSASDERLKNITKYNEVYDSLLDDLEPICYTWKDSTSKREFVGLGARKTDSLLEKHGLKNSGFVGIGKDENGEEVYSIDYQELSVMLLHKVQRQQEEIVTLKAQIADIMKRLEAVKC